MDPEAPRKFMRVYMHAITILVALFVFACTIPPKHPHSKPTAFSVLYFNDIHGHLRPFKVKTDQGSAEVGGIARLSTLVKIIREENRRAGRATVVLIAGDILQGTPMSTTFQGEPDVACFNRMGVDAATIGNHEFDFGLDNFLDLQQQAAFPFLSANIVYRESGRQLAQPYTLIRVTEAIDLAVIGVTTRDLTSTASTGNVADLMVLDPTQSALDIHNRLFAKGPVILLSHCKHHTDIDSATSMPNLTAIIGGHDQIMLSPHRMAGKVPIFQAFEKGRYLGRLDFELDKDSGQARLVSHDYIPVTADIPADPEVAEIVHRYANRMDAHFNQTIGRAAVFLDGERERTRWEETNLGNYVTDVMRRHTDADIALINGGSFRASINSGDITVADVFTAMPYANELITIDLRGHEIQAALDHAAQKERADEYGGFLHVSGLAFSIVNRQACNVVLLPEHRPLQPDVLYRVVITDFLYGGGDGYTNFKGKPARFTGSPLRELLVDTIRRDKLISARIEGRIRRIVPP